MIDHVSIAVRDLESATRFYQDALAPLGYTLREVRAKTVAFGKKYSEFWLNLRPDAMPLPEDNGSHVALRASSAEAVKALPDRVRTISPAVSGFGVIVKSRVAVPG